MRGVRHLGLIFVSFLRIDFISSWPFMDEEDCPEKDRPRIMDKLKWETAFKDVFASIGRDVGQYAPEYDMQFINALMKRGGQCHNANDLDCKGLAFDPRRAIRVWSLNMLAA